MRYIKIYLAVIILLINSNVYIFAQTQTVNEYSLSDIERKLESYKTDVIFCNTLKGSLICIINKIEQVGIGFELTSDVEMNLKKFIKRLWEKNNITVIRQNNREALDKQDMLDKESEIMATIFIKKLRRIYVLKKIGALTDNQIKNLNEDNFVELLMEVNRYLELFLTSEVDSYLELFFTSKEIPKEIKEKQEEEKRRVLGQLFIFRGKIFIQQNKFDNAIDEILKAIFVNYQGDKTFFLLGKAYYEKCKSISEKDDKTSYCESAMQIFDLLTNKDSKNPDYYLYLSYIFGELGKKEEEKTYFDKHKKLKAASPNIMNYIIK
jgi:tetratricopeptide (TPR) repeat protein